MVCHGRRGEAPLWAGRPEQLAAPGYANISPPNRVLSSSVIPERELTIAKPTIVAQISSVVKGIAPSEAGFLAVRSECSRPLK
jgi:hypothetical protein